MRLLQRTAFLVCFHKGHLASSCTLSNYSCSKCKEKQNISICIESKKPNYRNNSGSSGQSKTASMDEIEFAKLRAIRTCVRTWSACQRACVPAWFTYQRAKSVPTSHFYVPTCQMVCQFFNSACQRAKRHTDFSSIPLKKC